MVVGFKIAMSIYPGLCRLCIFRLVSIGPAFAPERIGHDRAAQASKF